MCWALSIPDELIHSSQIYEYSAYPKPQPSSSSHSYQDFRENSLHYAGEGSFREIIAVSGTNKKKEGKTLKPGKGVPVIRDSGFSGAIFDEYRLGLKPPGLGEGHVRSPGQHTIYRSNTTRR